MSRFAITLLVAGALGLGIAGRETTGSYPVPLAAVPWTAPETSFVTGDPANPGPNEIVEQYCVRCHNERRRIQNLVLEASTLPTRPSGAPRSRR